MLTKIRVYTRIQLDLKEYRIIKGTRLENYEKLNKSFVTTWCQICTIICDWRGHDSITDPVIKLLYIVGVILHKILDRRNCSLNHTDDMTHQNLIPQEINMLITYYSPPSLILRIFYCTRILPFLHFCRRYKIYFYGGWGHKLDIATLRLLACPIYRIISNGVLYNIK